jgi:hypothetical protein
MSNLFNKAFFKFAAGFAGILAMAIIGILAAGYYEMENGSSVPSAQQSNTQSR